MPLQFTEFARVVAAPCPSTDLLAHADCSAVTEVGNVMSRFSACFHE